MRGAALLALSLITIAPGCGPGAITARDASADDAGLDGAPDDAERSDAGVDASVLRACGETPGAPAWLEPLSTPHHLVARGERRDVHLWAFADGVLRVRYVAAASTPVERSFARVPALDALVAADIELGHEGDTLAWVCTPELAVRIEREGARVRVVSRSSGTILVEDVDDASEVSAARVVRSSPADELFLGLGERTGPLDRRGRRYVMRNTDAYDTRYGGFAPDADPLYLSVPFFVGVRGDEAYGLFTDVAYRLDLDMAASATDRYEIRSSGPELDQWLFAGPTPRDVVRRYTELTGRTPQPPRWSLGFHQSRWGYDTAARVEEVAAELRARAIPADALWLDIQHMDRFRSFTFDPMRFADPEGLTARLARDGFHVIAIEDPGIAEAPGYSVYDRAIAERAVLADASGTPHVDNAWPGHSVFLDFTLPAARALWSDEVEALVGRGIDGVWLDVNEPTTFPESGGETTVPDSLPVHGDGIATTMAEAHNVYALHQARATVDGLRAARPEQRPFVLCRAGYAGIQRYAAVWTGDAPSTWWSLRQSLPMLLGMGISGVPFVGSDVGGYSGRASPELYARWMELGAVSPFFRAHVTSGVPDQHPWSFGQEVEDISRERIRARYELLPYLESLFDEHTRTGLPPLRALALELFEERELRRVDDQAMLGPWLMVAPVLEEGASMRTVRVPAGRWLDLESGALWEGPADISLGVTLAAMPVLAREGTILPRASGVGAHTGEAPRGPLTIELFPAARETRFVLYEDAGDGYGAVARTTLSLEGSAGGARFVIGARDGDYEPGAQAIELRVMPVDREVSSVRVGGVELARLATREALEASGSGFVHDANARALVVRFARPGAAGTTVELAYDPTITELRPPVDVVLEVEVPEGTPMTTAIHVASDATGWAHQPLAWVSATLARGVVRAPRGSWLLYKYTRGSWETVEKWPDCEEASNRYGLARAGVRRDRVFAWRDLCE